MRKPCRHQIQRHQVEARRKRRDRQDDIVDVSVSSTATVITTSEEPAKAWLNKYLDPLPDEGELRELYRNEAGKTSSIQPNRSAADLFADDDTIVQPPAEEYFTHQLPEEMSEPASSSMYLDGKGGFQLSSLTPYLTSFLAFAKRFSEKNPKVVLMLGVAILTYWLLCALESWYPYIVADTVRFTKPWARWITINVQLFGRRISGFGQMLDDMVEGVYCDWATEWCRRYGMLCDAKCSFLDSAMQRARLP